MKIYSCLLLAGSVAVAAPAFCTSSYRFLHAIPAGGDGGWDYLAVDAPHHRLYVSHASKVIVIDTMNDKVVGEIADTPGVHGIASAPEAGRVFTSNGRDNNVSVVDPGTLQTLSHVATGANPDAIMYEPAQREVYAFNGRGQSATVFIAATGDVVATIPLDGKPEFAQADPSVGHVFVNIEDKSVVAALDVKAHKVFARWPIAPGEEATGMAIDLAHHRLFLGCSNARLVVMDSSSGKVVAAIPAGQGIDAAAFDPGTQLAFTSNGRDGTVTVVHEDTPDTFSVIQTLTTQVGSRTMTVDPVSHKIYLSAADYEAPAAGVEGNRARPRMVPGSFKVLVYGIGG